VHQGHVSTCASDRLVVAVTNAKRRRNVCHLIYYVYILGGVSHVANVEIPTQTSGSGLLEGFGDGGGEVGEDHVGSRAFYRGELF
jgi:hypothetical protein